MPVIRINQEQYDILEQLIHTNYLHNYTDALMLLTRSYLNKQAEQVPIPPEDIIPAAVHNKIILQVEQLNKAVVGIINKFKELEDDIKLLQAEYEDVMKEQRFIDRRLSGKALVVTGYDS